VWLTAAEFLAQLHWDSFWDCNNSYQKELGILRKRTYYFKYGNNAITPFCFSGSEYSLCGKPTLKQRELI
jgi:hypothetical protein